MEPLRWIEVVLYVEDVASAAGFLEQVAGLRVAERDPGFTVLVHPDGLRLALRPAPLAAATADGARAQGPAPPPAELVLATTDLRAALDDACAHGAVELLAPRAFRYGDVATVRAPGSLRISFFARR